MTENPTQDAHMLRSPLGGHHQDTADERSILDIPKPVPTISVTVDVKWWISITFYLDEINKVLYWFLTLLLYPDINHGEGFVMDASAFLEEDLNFRIYHTQLISLL